MHRRHFNRRLLAGLGAGIVLSTCKSNAQETNTTATAETTPDERIKPKRLKKGDTIALITPGSFIPDKGLKKAIDNLLDLGFKVVQAPNLRAKRGYNAGTDQQRLDDLHYAFRNPDIDAIWCARGGYGCTRLLPMIDYELIRANPKILVGYSDITALHNAIFQRTGLVTFHGPVAGSTFTEYAKTHIRAVLMSDKKQHVIHLAEDKLKKTDELFQAFTIRKGVAQGQLAGGNLTLLASMAGTPYEVDLRDKLLFLEDIEEKPYRIDRMLTQLRQSSPMEEVAGFALGIFNDCVPEPGDNSLSLPETVRDRLGDLNKPAAYGFSFGHISDQCILPVGIKAEMDTESQRITLLETATS